ncbi:MAG: DUF2066 domain-containing protein [Sulfurifustaceae bacterium]
MTIRMPTFPRCGAALLSKAVLVGFLMMTGRAFAVEVSGLYDAETIVTGRGEAERLRGFGIGLSEVIVKLSGDARSAQSAAVQQLLPRADEFVERYEYEDRMKGIPIHDEQGTRDRPHYLRMTFKHAAVDEALKRLGLPRWGSDRPRLIVWLGIKDSVRSYVLDSETEFGFGQREVLKSVSRQRGVPLVLPAPESPARTSVTYADIAHGDLPRMRSASMPYGADAILYGTLVMDKNGYWTAVWSLDWNKRARRNEMHGVTFDVALRTAVERAAKTFSTSAPHG